jgi:cytochrome c-type biogenesis protein CcmH/NrfG
MKTRDELCDERDFLLRSLDDLETERADGNIDDDTYKLLHSDYTARAAAVIRTLDDGEDRDRESADRPRARTGLRAATIVGVVVFVVLVAVGLAHAIGQRPPGGTGSGKQFNNSASSSDPCAAPKAATIATPKSYEPHIEYARCLVQQSDFADASEQYFAAAQIDPKQAEPLAYVGWLSALQASQATNAQLRTTLLTLARTSLDRAIQVDPTYPDSYVFKGLLLDQFDKQPAQAVPYLRKFLALAPKDHPMRSQVQQVLSQALAARKP